MKQPLRIFHLYLHHSQHQIFVLWTWSEGFPSKRSVCYQLCCCASHTVFVHQEKNRTDVPLGWDIRRMCTGSHSSLQVHRVFLLHRPGRKDGTLGLGSSACFRNEWSHFKQNTWVLACVLVVSWTCKKKQVFLILCSALWWPYLEHCIQLCGAQHKKVIFLGNIFCV